MEDVLDLYEEPYDPQRPTVCLDEKPVVLHAATRPGLPSVPGPEGHPQRQDYEYERGGTANLFVMVEPQAGWRHVAVTDQRTKQDDARVPALAGGGALSRRRSHPPGAGQPQHPWRCRSLRAFPSLRGHGLSLRVWTSIRRPSMAVGESIAEIEISVFERGCLSRPVGDRATLQRRVATLEAERNAARATIHWQFTSREARVKLVDLYPVKQTERD